MSDKMESGVQSGERSFSRHVARYVLGMMVACGTAFGIGWELSFILPVFLAKFLVDYPASDREVFRQLVLAMVLTVLIGMGIGLGAGRYPLVLLLLVGLLMFWAYYLFLDPKWNFFATILMIAVMLLPYLGLTHPALLIYVGQGLGLSGVLAVVVFAALHWLLPDISGNCPQVREPLPHEERVKAAFSALLTAYPVIVFFYYFQIDGAILTMVFIGILSLQTTAVKSAKIGAFLLLTNGIGGLLAVLLYELLVTTPHFLFLLALITLISLAISGRIYRQPEKAAVWAGIMSAMLVVFGGAISSDSKLIEVSFYSRIVQIVLASTYMIAVSLLMELWRKKFVRTSVSGGGG